MLMPDVNVLVYAHRGEMDEHQRHRSWLRSLLNGVESYAVSDAVLNGFLRLTTNRRVFAEPTPLDDALHFADVFRQRPHAVVVEPGPRHWSVFRQLCSEIGACARDFPDAYLAALAIEHGCEFVTADQGFGRFGGLRLRTVAQLER